MIKKRNCPCPDGPGKPCSQFGGFVMDEELWKICNGENISAEEQNNFINFMVFNRFIKFIKSVKRHILNGSKVVSNEEYQKRLSICEICEFCDKSDDVWKCKICTCNLQEGDILPGKARWDSETCPIKKWPLQVIQNTSNVGCNCS